MGRVRASSDARDDDDDDDDDDEGDAASRAAAGAGSGAKGPAARSMHGNNGPLEHERDADMLLERPRTLAKKGEFTQAIDAYLLLSVTENKQVVNHDILDKVWEEVMELAQRYSRERYPGVASTVAHQMIGVRRFAEAAGILQVMADCF